jgi:hypothetical protein
MIFEEYSLQHAANLSSTLPKEEHEMGEEDLIKRARQKDSDAFAQLIQSYMSEIDAEILRLIDKLIDEAGTTDIGKTIIVKAWNDIADFQGGAERFPDWLGKLAKEICLDILLTWAKQGNEKAFNILIRDYEVLIYGVIARYKNLREYVEDILQTVKLEAWRITALNFELTAESFQGLRNAGVPDEIVEKLQPLQGQGWKHKNEFLIAVCEQIGEKQTNRYEEVILKCARIERFRGEANALRAWLRIRTTGTCLDLIRKPARQGKELSLEKIPLAMESDPKAGKPFEEQEEAEIVRKALQSDRLSVIEKHIVSLRFVGVSNKEIAQLPLIVFKITNQVLGKLKEGNMPENLLNELKPLRDQQFLAERQFLDTVGKYLEKNHADRYRDQILRHAKRTLTNQDIAVLVFNAITKIRAIFREQGIIDAGDEEI